MAQKVIWTQQARNDLQHIYNFYCGFLKEGKAFSLIEEIIDRTDSFYQPVIGSTRYISNLNKEIPYQKLVVRHFIVIFREENQIVYVNRVFDSRQDPKKLKI